MYHRILLKFFSVTLANVTQLNLSCCGIGVQAAEMLGNVLKKNTALVHLDLSYNSLGKGGMKQLAAGLTENTKLEVCLLCGCGDKHVECECTDYELAIPYLSLPSFLPPPPPPPHPVPPNGPVCPWCSWCSLLGSCPGKARVYSEGASRLLQREYASNECTDL